MTKKHMFLPGENGFAVCQKEECETGNKEDKKYFIVGVNDILLGFIL